MTMAYVARMQRESGSDVYDVHAVAKSWEAAMNALDESHPFAPDEVDWVEADASRGTEFPDGSWLLVYNGDEILAVVTEHEFI